MKTNRIVALLAVLCLITTCFVGTTLAKYTTTAEGADTARVAKFGVVLSAGSEYFKTSYDDGAVSVLADNGDDVVAPGTTGTATAFTIAGAPEVDVQVTVTLDKDDALSMVKLPAATATYLDWTTAATDDKYDLAADYYPVVWTLKQDGADVVSGNLEDIEAELTSMSKKYEVESGDFADLVGTWTLDWAWDFSVNDKADTTLGQVAAGVDTATGAVLDETFGFSITVTQLD